MLTLGFKRRRVDNVGVFSCVCVCFSVMSTYRHVQCKHSVLACADIFVCEVYPDGLWDSTVCRVQYLIRMNFSNDPLLAGVDQRGGAETRQEVLLLSCCISVSSFHCKFHFHYCFKCRAAFLNRRESK